MIFWYFQGLYLMYSEVTWVLVSSGTQVQPQIILKPGYLPFQARLSFRFLWLCLNIFVVVPFINSCRANQWTGFYMITASAMKELMVFSWLLIFPFDVLVLKILMSLSLNRESSNLPILLVNWEAGGPYKLWKYHVFLSILSLLSLWILLLKSI